MTYYTCVTCHHTTMDHDKHGRGPCLIEGCTCGEMKDGDVFVKRVRPKVDRTAAIAAAAALSKSMEKQ